MGFYCIVRKFRYLPHQCHAVMVFDGVVGVVFKRVGIDILPAVQDLSVSGAVPSLVLVCAFIQYISPPVEYPEDKISTYITQYVQHVVESIAVG